MKKTPIEANVSYFGKEAKIVFYIDEVKYAFRCDKNDLALLLNNEGEATQKIAL